MPNEDKTTVFLKQALSTSYDQRIRPSVTRKVECATQMYKITNALDKRNKKSKSMI